VAIAECKRAHRGQIQLSGNPYNDIGVYLIEQGALDDARGPGSNAPSARRATSRATSPT